MSRACAALLAAAVLGGCAPAAVTMGQLPAVASPAQAGEVVVVRERGFIASDFSYYVNVNQQNIVALESGEHTRLQLPAGQHRIALRCYAPLDGGWKETAVTEYVPAQGTVYLQAAPRYDCASLTPVTEAQARKLLSGTSAKAP
jgi:hypothetical protein